jgi:hypothetical protein
VGAFAPLILRPHHSCIRSAVMSSSSIQLPTEIYDRIFAFSGDNTRCSVARASRVFHDLVIPYLYAAPDLSAIPTLLSRSDLAKHAKSVIITWDSHIFKHNDSVSHDSRVGKLSTPVALTREQAEQYRIDKDNLILLHLCYPPIQTTLLLRICRHLEAFHGFMAYEMVFFDAHFPPLIDPFGHAPDRSANCPFQRITAIDISPCTQWREYDRPWALDASMLLRIMLLPALRKMVVDTVLQGQDWSESIAAITPSLHGSSSVTDLRLIGTLVTPVLCDLIHVPRALSTFCYGHTPLGTLETSNLAEALINSPSRSSLRRIEIFVAGHGQLEANPLPSFDGDLHGLKYLPDLRSLTTDTQMLLGCAVEEADMAHRLVDALPKTLHTLVLQHFTTSFSSSKLAADTASQVIETFGPYLLNHLDLGLDHEGWSEDDVARVKALASRQDVQI